MCLYMYSCIRAICENIHRGRVLIWGGYGKYRSLLQNIVCFIGLFCKRDLQFYRSYWPMPPGNTITSDQMPGVEIYIWYTRIYVNITICYTCMYMCIWCDDTWCNGNIHRYRMSITLYGEYIIIYVWYAQIYINIEYAIHASSCTYDNV